MIYIVTKGFCASEDIACSYQGLGNRNKQTEPCVVFKQPSPEITLPTDYASTLCSGYILKEIPEPMAACVKYTPILCTETQFQLLWPLCWIFAFPLLSVTVTIELLQHLEKYNLWHFVQFLHPYACALLKKQTENPRNSGVHGQEKLWLGRIKKPNDIYWGERL